MQPSIFTRIIRGEVPCFKIYEDDKTIAILDIHPVRPGHILVITKKQIDHFEDLPDEDYQALWTAVKKIARHQKSVLGSQRIGVSIVGTDIPHAHVHLIPFEKSQELRAVIDLSRQPDKVALAAMAKQLAFKDIAK